MTERRFRPDEAADLRKRAEEEVMAAEAGTEESLSPQRTRQVLHELRVHQVELEMQNEELRRAQIELEAARARYFDLYDLAPVGYLTVSERGVILEANLTGATLLNVARGALDKQPLTRFIFRDDQDIFYQHRRRLFETGAPQVFELRMVRHDGTPLWVQLEAAAAWDADGAPVCRAVVSDIAERKRAEEEALRASEARHRTLFEASKDALMTLAPPSWRFTSGNSATIAMFGARDEAEFVSRTPWQWSPERQPDGRDSAQKAMEMIETAMREGSHFFEWTHQRASGQKFTATVLLTRMGLDGQPLLQATLRDETKRRRLEAALAQADRLASMGMLAASVAHEINNPLAYVVYNLESLAKDLPKLAGATKRCCAALRDQVGDVAFSEITGDGAEMLEPAMLEDAVDRTREALGGIHRIKDVSRGLGTFSRIERGELSKVALNRAIEQAANMAQNEIKFRAKLVKDFGRVPAILASEGKLSQVFLNLLVNAAHAIDEDDVESNCIGLRTWAEAGDVFAEVSDTGKGIPPENLERIFEPFFTTKGVGVGSGLGLAICRSIVNEFGGDIRVESEIGKGTRFVIRLPVMAEAPEERRDRAISETSRQPAVRGRILVVDDEEGICRTMQRLLGRKHEVVTATSGAEARALLEQDQAFDLILCDLMMPGMSGMALHAWLAARDPTRAQQMVFLTGGAFTPRAADYLASVANRRIEKPFDPVDLERLVPELIVEARTRR